MIMDYSDIYAEEEDELYQPTTNEESLIEKKYKKWLNSNTDISHISSIFRLEQESLNRKKCESIYLKESKNGEKYNECKTNEREEKSEVESEENVEIEDISSEKEKKEKNKEENLSGETLEDSKNIKKNHMFIWDEGGNDVKVTGSFSDWKIQYQMIRDQFDQIFRLELPLGNEIYQYKFIVDGEWKYSKNYPTKPDDMGNINNILDNTKIQLFDSKEKMKEKKKKKKTSTTKKSKKTKKTKKTKSKKKSQRKSSIKTKTAKTRASTINKESIKIVKKDSIYKSVYPSDDDIVPLPLPNKRYYKTFKLENFTNQTSIGNKNFYDYYDRYCLSYPASSKPIFILGHVNLNHLISVNHNNKSNILKNSMSFRYREKATTFIYYKHN